MGFGEFVKRRNAEYEAAQKAKENQPDDLSTPPLGLPSRWKKRWGVLDKEQRQAVIKELGL